MTESVFHNKYSLVKGAARRARQLQGGAAPTIAAKSMKACRVAQDEIKQGQVTYVLNTAKVAEGPVVVPAEAPAEVESAMAEAPVMEAHAMAPMEAEGGEAQDVPVHHVAAEEPGE